MKIRYAPLAVACALMVAASAQAAPVTYYFGGTLNRVGPSLLPLSIGNSFAGSFTFDTTSLDVLTDPAIGVYEESFAIDVTVNGFTYSSSTSAANCPDCGAVRVFDDSNSFGGDSFFIATNAGSNPGSAPLTGPNLNGLAPAFLYVALNSNSTAFSSDALPSSLSLSSVSFSTELAIGFANSAGDLNVASGGLRYLSTTPPIPETSTSAMLALGLGALAVARRRKVH